jgi:hypothetical protein
MRLFVLSLFLLGCGKSSTSLVPPDGGAPDGGAPDGGAPDGGAPDGGAPDGGFSDLGAVGSLDTCFAGLSPRVANGTVNLLDFVAEGGVTHVRLAREAGSQPFVGETTPYDLVRFGIERNGVTECITDLSLLSYNFGHHNWKDTATATGSQTYTVTMSYDYGPSAPRASWTDTLSLDGGAPMPLVFTSCRSIPTLDANHCLLRGGGG